MKAKLPVFATVGRALNTVFTTRILLSGCFIKCFLAYFLAIELPGSIFLLTVGTFEYYSLYSTLTLLPLYFIMAPFFIAIHRLIIIGDELPSKPFKNFFSKRNVKFAVYWFLLISPLMIIMVISEFDEKYGFLENSVLVGWLLLVAFLIIYLRVVIYLPFIAIDNRQTLSRCWDITRGSTWRFFGAMVIFLVITVLIKRFVLVPLEELAAGWWQEETFSSVLVFVGVLSIDLIYNFIYFVSFCWLVAIVSHAFNFFREEKGFDILEEKG